MDPPITLEQLARYSAGELLQNAFPQLSAGEREFIKTGITPEEWVDERERGRGRERRERNGGTEREREKRERDGWKRGR